MQTAFTMAGPLPAAKRTRIESIDLLRGIVIVIMALDHVRDYFHGDAYLFDPTDLSKTSLILFFTRWITHFCAPIFTFLAGTSAYLSGQRKTKKQLSIFLLTRGLWLVLLEVFIITPGWTFNSPSNLVILQVIWSLGIGMVALAAFVQLPRWVIITTGLLLIGGHNLLDSIHMPPANNAASLGWGMLHQRGLYSFYQFSILLGYPVLPWIGIMLLGYGAGKLYSTNYDAEKRRKILMLAGFGAIVMFIVIRGINVYGDPMPWQVQPTTVFTALSFLNVSKYPPSLLYILLTLGPAMLFLAFSEKKENSISRHLVVLGRVPMFFYIIHIYVIHIIALIAAILTGFSWHDMVLTTWVTNSDKLKGYGFSLGMVYLIWIVLILLLYPLCKWYDNYKRKHQGEKKWLSYI